MTKRYVFWTQGLVFISLIWGILATAAFGEAPKITITTQPSQITAVDGAANFSVEASVDQGMTLSYQWQLWTQKTRAYSDLPGENQSSISLKNLTYAVNNYSYYRVKLSAPGASTTYTRGGRLLLTQPKITITTQPSQITAVDGAANFSVEASVDQGVTLSYQWQLWTQKTKAYSDLPGENQSSISLKNLTYAVNNYSYYRVKLSAPGASTTYTRGGRLLLTQPKITITTQPSQITAVDGAANFSVEASVDQGMTLSYQWQLWTQKTRAYSDLPGENQSSIFLTNLTYAANNDSYYRVKLSAPGASTTYTRGGRLLLTQPKITITTQPSQITAVDGAANFSVEASVDQGVTLSYQWQLWTQKTKAYSDLPGENQSSISLKNLTYAANNDSYYRVKLSAPGASTKYTRGGRLLLSPPVISSVSPARAGEGDTIVISGTNFAAGMKVDARPIGASQSQSLCTLGDSNCSFTSNTITVGKLPAAPAGDYEVRITYFEGSTAKLSESVGRFNLQGSSLPKEHLQILAVTPNSGKAGDPIVVTGTGFEDGVRVIANPGNLTMLTNGENAPCKRDSSKQITCVVPTLPPEAQNQKDFDIYVADKNGVVAPSSVKFGYEKSTLNMVKKISSDPKTEKQFGYRLAVDGNSAIVGSLILTDNAYTGSKLYFYERDISGTWTEKQNMALPQINAVAISGNTAIIGCPYQNSGGGLVFIYERDDKGIWTEKARFSGEPQEPFYSKSESMGLSVAISGNTAVAGAPNFSGDFLHAGRVYVFERSQAGEWVKRIVLKSREPKYGSVFGWSVSISGDSLAVGAPNDYEGQVDLSSLVYDRYVKKSSINIFQKVNDSWISVSKITSGDLPAGRLNIVSLSGNTLLSGWENHALVYNKIGNSTWAGPASLNSESQDSYTEFGASVAISNNRILIGDPAENRPRSFEGGDRAVPGSGSGAFYLYDLKSNGNWTQIAKNLGNSAAIRFSDTVAISGENVLIADPWDGADGQGAVYFIRLPEDGLGSTNVDQPLMNGEVQDNTDYKAPSSGTVKMSCQGGLAMYANIWAGDRDPVTGMPPHIKNMVPQTNNETLTYEFPIEAGQYFRLDCQAYSHFSANFTPRSKPVTQE